MLNTYFMCTALLFMMACSILADKPASQVQQPVHFKMMIKVEMDYLLYLPPDYKKKNSWPLLLFLHGKGERGNNLKLVKKHGPPKLIAEGKQFAFIVVSPQCPKNQWWQSVELSALLDEVVSKHKVDKDRIYVTGLSMGGSGTWSLAAHTPYRFAAIVPISGGGETYWTRSISRIPTWIFHGAKDKVVPLERSVAMADALTKLGGNVKLTAYPHTYHDSWTETYNNSKLYKWLLEQKK